MKTIFLECKKLYTHFDKILFLFAFVFAIVEFAWIPINSWLSEVLLSWTGYAYLSPTNVVAVLTEKWWVTICLFLLVLLNLIIAYLEVGLVVVGITRLIRENDSFSAYLRHVGQEMLRVLKQMRVSKVIFTLLYSIVFFPFLRRILQIYYLDKIVIPQFILDYLSDKYFFGALFVACLLLFFWIASQLLFTLPLIYQDGKSVKEAISISLVKTKQKGRLKTYIRLILSVVYTLLVFLLFAAILYILQILADTLPDVLAFACAMLHFILLQLAHYGVISLFLLKFFSMAVDEELLLPIRRKHYHRLRLGILLLASIYFGIQGYIYLYFPFYTLPVTISHRGVDNQNGVQNTIEALEKTAQLKPDYVEMDVQETQDGQFVVMHDINLKELTGYDGGTHDYTLEELKEMMVFENGQSSPLASFDDYLVAAERLKQKLIVEIKVTSADSPQMMQRFLQLYGQRLLAGGHQMQSLDYGVVLAIKEFSPQLQTAFILPFNSIYPTTVADGYTLEHTSLDQSFLVKSWIRGKYVYAWTLNDKVDMLKMIQFQVDGIITDQLSELKSAIKEFSESHSYADLLFIQAQLLFSQF